MFFTDVVDVVHPIFKTGLLMSALFIGFTMITLPIDFAMAAFKLVEAITLIGALIILGTFVTKDLIGCSSLILDLSSALLSSLAMLGVLVAFTFCVAGLATGLHGRTMEDTFTGNLRMDLGVKFEIGWFGFRIKRTF